MSQRTTKEVFEDHLNKRKDGKVEEDIAENFAGDVVLLTGTGLYRGHAGVRENARQLQAYLPDGRFEYHNVLVDGEIAFLEWRGYSANGVVEDGADSFVIRDGKIVAQTIHYTVLKRPADMP